jgi:hypothetical protein
VYRPSASPNRDLSTAPRRFALYVEGPRDRDVLRQFANKLSPELARTMDPCVQILGGRRPERAAKLFRSKVSQADSGDETPPTALCILDRDDPVNCRNDFPEEPGLDFVIWKRRQIESYLMVPRAIRNCCRSTRHSPALDHLLDVLIPDPGDEAKLRDLDAKRVLAAQGPIARVVGRPLRARDIVRSMSPLDVHADVRGVLAVIRDQLGGRPSSHPQHDSPGSLTR